MNRAIGKCAIVFILTQRKPRNPQNFTVAFFLLTLYVQCIVMDNSFIDILENGTECGRHYWYFIAFSDVETQRVNGRHPIRNQLRKMNFDVRQPWMEHNLLWDRGSIIEIKPSEGIFFKNHHFIAFFILKVTFKVLIVPKQLIRATLNIKTNFFC